MFVYLAMSEMQCIIYRPDLHNSQASRKKLKKYLISKPKIGLMLKFPNISEICITYRLLNG